MKSGSILLLVLLSAPGFSQNKAEPKTTAPAVTACVDRSEMQDELTESRALVLRMQNRILMMRNSVGTVRDFELRNALQINADAWQDLLDNLKLRITRLQTVVDRCEAREKINTK